jgi:two-component system, OmpR family, sensor histidine kinase KdpD
VPGGLQTASAVACRELFPHNAPARAIAEKSLSPAGAMPRRGEYGWAFLCSGEVVRELSDQESTAAAARQRYSPDEPRPSPGNAGRLHIYLGAVPAAGKTYAMLAEGRRRAALGDDVVVGLLETHGRAGLNQAAAPFETIPRRNIEYRGATLGELDVDAVLARRPDVVLVDELAHRNVPGSRRDKRWQDVDVLTQAGIDVITTLNVIHLADLHDAVEEITGVSQREFVPEAMVLAAHRVDFVDTDPRLVLRRLEPQVRPADRAPGLRNGFFDLDRLDLLRRLARTWLCQRSLGAPGERRKAGMAAQAGPVVVALAPGATAGRVVRRAAELAAMRHAPLVGVHVSDTSGVEVGAARGSRMLERMLAEFGGRYAEVRGTDIAWELARFAAREGAGVLVIGDTSHSVGYRLMHGSIARRTLRLIGPIEVYVVPPQNRPSDGEPAPDQVAVARLALFPPRRRAVSWLLAVAVPIALMAALSPARASIGLGGALLCAFLAVVAIALVGGVAAALAATALSVLAADFFFAPPYHSLRVAHLIDVLALVVFAVCGAVIGVLVEVLAGRASRTARTRAEAEQLVRLLAAELAVAPEPTAGMAAELRAAFDLDAVGFLGRDGRGWHLIAGAGASLPDHPDAAQFAAEIAPGRVLVLTGPTLGRPRSDLLAVFEAELLAGRRRAQQRGIAAHGVGEQPQVSR